MLHFIYLFDFSYIFIKKFCYSCYYCSAFLITHVLFCNLLNYIFSYPNSYLFSFFKCYLLLYYVLIIYVFLTFFLAYVYIKKMLFILHMSAVAIACVIDEWLTCD